MSRSLTKAQRTRLAADAVAAIAETLQMIDDYFAKTSTPGFEYKPHANMPGDGSVAFHLPQHQNRFVAISNHQQVTDSGFVAKLESAFAPAAEALATLMPGKFLHWTLGEKGSGRHQLFLGAPHARHPHVIDTVLSRWKSPLVRLSYYFAEAEEDLQNSEVHNFHLQLRPDIADGENLFETYALYVSARTVDEAFRLAAFNSPNGAAPEPRDCHNRFAFKLGAHFTREDYVNSLSEGLALRKTAHDKGKAVLQNGLEDLIESVRDHIDALRQHADIEITADLLECKTSARVKASPFATSGDFAAVSSRQDDLQDASEALMGRLSDALNIIHPEAYQGTIKLTVPCHRDVHATSYTAQAMIDDLPMHATLQTIEHFMHQAARLSAVTIKGPHRLFAMQAAFESGPNIIGANRKSYYVHATSHAHATLILNHHASDAMVLSEAIPVENDVVLAGRANRAAAIATFSK